MVRKHILIAMIAPVALAGILIIAILASQAFASSYGYNSKRGHNDDAFYKSSYKCRGHYCKLQVSKSTRNGNVGGSKSVTTGNAAQEKQQYRESSTGEQQYRESSTGEQQYRESSTGEQQYRESSTGERAIPGK